VSPDHPMYDSIYHSKVSTHVSNMIQAYVVARMKSKDPNTKVGSMVYDPKTTATFIGYNGFPSGIPDMKSIWDNRDASDPRSKYAFVTHSESNSIRKAHQCLGHLEGCWLYVSHYPCGTCMRGHIAMSGIKKVYYADDKHYDPVSDDIARGCGIEMRLLPMPKVQLLIDGVEI
jgi:dCMP deaminase